MTLNAQIKAGLGAVLPLVGFIVATAVPVFGPPMNTVQTVVWVSVIMVGSFFGGVGLLYKSKFAFESIRGDP